MTLTRRGFLGRALGLAAAAAAPGWLRPAPAAAGAPEAVLRLPGGAVAGPVVLTGVRAYSRSATPGHVAVYLDGRLLAQTPTLAARRPGDAVGDAVGYCPITPPVRVERGEVKLRIVGPVEGGVVYHLLR